MCEVCAAPCAVLPPVRRPDVPHQLGQSPAHAWSKLLSHSSITHRMKSWLKSTSIPAIVLIALALGTLWMCFLLATHRHTGILKTVLQARQFLTPGSTSARAHQNDAVAPAGPQHTVTLSWTASATAGVSYNVYRRDTSGTVKLNSAPLNATTYVDKTVQPGHTYHYVAKAVKGNGGESIASNEVQVTIPEP